jgi:hypothetical protein
MFKGNDEVATPETARTPDNKVLVENPHTAGIGCKDNAALRKFNQKVEYRVL